ncbi:hypothetical protein JTE90_017583 [Oedothorax gibbosus]|uniref:Uncharacterized protein n=1 Tax=Oedothorax gibbosus TaxID=931172 RepID=A0AAV6TL17_9ARAC|nr:hypothetical protein JTE90_017583 [Oedothorax gibbosus]
MNFSRYCSIYSRFHGATSYRTEQDIIILDLLEESFDNWILLRMFQFDDIQMRPEQGFAKALQMHLESQSPLTVFCQNDTWIALSGHDKYVTPIITAEANFQMYATPYFVRDPSTLADTMQAHHSDTVFRYKNCIVYLDRQDLPAPGACYFNASTVTPSSLYRICLLSREPQSAALLVATEWKTRRDIVTLPFPTTDSISVPAMISFKPIDPPYLPNERVVSNGNIQKRLSLYQPQCLLQDILASYQRNTRPDQPIQDLGLVVEWPFRITFEGTRTNAADTLHKKFVALVANGLKAKRILVVRYPYEVYTEYDQVPALPYIVFHFTSTILELPPDMEKVSVDSTVIGYRQEKGFYCFNFPLLEGRPTAASSRNVDCLCTVPPNPKGRIEYTFQINDTWVLHKVNTDTGLKHGWCLAQTDGRRVYDEAPTLPYLVRQWLNMFEGYDKAAEPIDVKMLQMALTLARHKICFKTNLVTEKKSYHMLVTDTEITVSLSADEVQFINSRRADGLDWSQEEEKEAESCTIM